MNEQPFAQISEKQIILKDNKHQKCQLKDTNQNLTITSSVETHSDPVACLKNWKLQRKAKASQSKHLDLIVISTTPTHLFYLIL